MSLRKHQAAVVGTILLLLLGACGAKKDATGSRSSRRPTATSSVATSGGVAGEPAAAAGTAARSGKGDPTQQKEWAAYERKLDAWKKRCVDSPPESQEERATCEQTQPKTPEQEMPYAKNKFNEIVSMEDLKKWWPYRPLYRSPAASDGGAAEVFVAASSEGGRKGDGSSEAAYAIVLYAYPATTVDTSSRGDLLKNRAVIVGSRFAGLGTPPSVAPQGPGEKPVAVRGHAGRTFVATLAGFGGFKIRIVEWNEPTDGGGTLWRQATTGAEAYSEEQVLEFLNGMEEIR